MVPQVNKWQIAKLEDFQGLAPIIKLVVLPTPVHKRLVKAPDTPIGLSPDCHRAALPVLANAFYALTPARRYVITNRNLALIDAFQHPLGGVFIKAEQETL